MYIHVHSYFTSSFYICRIVKIKIFIYYISEISEEKESNTETRLKPVTFMCFQMHVFILNAVPEAFLCVLA